MLWSVYSITMMPMMMRPTPLEYHADRSAPER